MKQLAARRHPWKAIAAVAAMAIAVHETGACAGTPEPEATGADVVRELPLRQACAEVDEVLPDALALAWDDAVKPSTSTVTFKVRRHAIFDVLPQAESPRLAHALRRAVHHLNCDSGDDQAHVVRLVVRFIERGGAERVAVIAPEGDDDTSWR